MAEPHFLDALGVCLIHDDCYDKYHTNCCQKCEKHDHDLGCEYVDHWYCHTYCNTDDVTPVAMKKNAVVSDMIYTACAEFIQRNKDVRAHELYRYIMLLDSSLTKYMVSNMMLTITTRAVKEINDVILQWVCEHIIYAGPLADVLFSMTRAPDYLVKLGYRPEFVELYYNLQRRITLKYPNQPLKFDDTIMQHAMMRCDDNTIARFGIEQESFDTMMEHMYRYCGDCHLLFPAIFRANKMKVRHVQHVLECNPILFIRNFTLELVELPQQQTLRVYNSGVIDWSSDENPTVNEYKNEYIPYTKRVKSCNKPECKCGDSSNIRNLCADAWHDIFRAIDHYFLSRKYYQIVMYDVIRDLQPCAPLEDMVVSLMRKLAPTS